jgi:hypothetical protein
MAKDLAVTEKRNCHSERSEESLISPARSFAKKVQDDKRSKRSLRSTLRVAHELRMTKGLEDPCEAHFVSERKLRMTRELSF